MNTTPTPEAPLAWHQQSVSGVLQVLETDIATGLSTAEARQRLEIYGGNELIDHGGKHPLRIIWEQISSTVVLILILAVVISAFLGKGTEAVAIGAIVLLFTILGFIQEYRAEQAMAALKQLAVPHVRVRRDGRLQELSAQELAPGDVVLLEAGNVAPADMRLAESVNLRIQEAALTGESEPVEKDIAELNAPALPLGDRRNMAYMGTIVTYGRGAAIVVDTGMNTELGKIAALMQEVTVHLTPLQRQLNRVGNLLAVGGILVALLVLGIGLLGGATLEDMFLTAISVAVAVVPEGLPAVITVALALGAQRMLRRRALIRKLPAVETLGSVTVICSDKTGTLTENRMTVTVIDVAGHYLELTGARHPAPVFGARQAAVDIASQQPPAIGLTLAIGMLCNDAALAPDPQTGRDAVVGDPTEGALLVAATQAGLRQQDLQAVLPRVAELPFDADRKRMTTAHRLAVDAAELPAALRILPVTHAPYCILTKGAVDGLLEVCRHIWVRETIEPLSPSWRTSIEIANNEMAQKGMRVLGVAWRACDDSAEAREEDLVFVGLIGMIDPPRPEVKEAVATCKAAGIRPIMITGDHPLTARFIAHDLGIAETDGVRTGQDLAQLSPGELERVVDQVSVYARVSPEHKLRIVEALQRRGEIVAMTGDGVNDSPALRQADIGIAMGVTGTDVSKEAADAVLLDDNFATIVAAVEEGRVIYDNIRRFVKFSIAGNLGKVLVMLLAPLFGATVALLPLQLLWLNLLTDGLLGLGLSLEPAEAQTMQRPPRSPSASLFSEGVGWQVIWVGALLGLTALGVGMWHYDPLNPAHSPWRAMMFTVLAFSQIGQAVASRSSQIWRFSPALIGMVLLTLALQLLVIYTPFLQGFFGVAALSATELLVCLTLASLVLIALEVERQARRRRH